MLVSLAWAALRRRPFSVVCTLILDLAWSSLLGLPAPLVLLVWGLGWLGLLELWWLLEPRLLGWCGCREPQRAERERLNACMRALAIKVWVVDDPAPFVTGTLRAVLVSSGALELVEERALFGLVARAASRQHASSLIPEGLVWLGNLPLLVGWSLSRAVGQLARVLAIVIGYALVLPLLVCPRAFVRWTGRLLTAVFVVLLGALLVSSGLSAPGVLLLLGWALLPGMQALLAWELRGAEADADLALVSSNLGGPLLEGLERLASMEPERPRGLLALLSRPQSPLAVRRQRIEQALGLVGASVAT